MSSANDEIYSLLVPLNQKRLILPRACVSEVIRYAPLQASDAAHPDWLRGMISWNGKHIPVISFEELAGLTPGAIGGPPTVAGAHTREILEAAGYAAEDIDALTAAGVA